MTEFTVTLPDDLARKAKEAGLLTPEGIERALREAMKKQRVDRLFATMAKLSQLKPALSEEEIAAEIEAARQARRNANRR